MKEVRKGKQNIEGRRGEQRKTELNRREERMRKVMVGMSLFAFCSSSPKHHSFHCCYDGVRWVGTGGH